MLKLNALQKSIFFGLFLFLLNGVLNLPHWINRVFQSNYINEIDNTSLLKALLYAPNKEVLLPLNGDLCLLFIPLLFLGKFKILKSVYFVFASFLFLLLLYYNIYYEGYQGLYHVHPIFASDWIIVKEILPTFFNELSIAKSNYLFGIIAIVLVSILLFVAIFKVFQFFSTLKKYNYFWGLPFLLLATLSLFIQSDKEKEILNEENISLENKSSQSINWIYSKILKSGTLNREDNLAHLKKRWIYDLYLSKKLVKKKPNIYLLFIESYGGVATLTDECGAKYEQLTDSLEAQLTARDWHISSNYSKSTVIGGRSWLALTTAMTGARIENQIQYKGLIQEHRTFPHMIDFFNNQGYETVRVSTMSSKDIDTMSMITIPNLFWGFDQRLLFSDIPYKGFRYDYYGGIPDQYTLGYVEETILDTLTTPHFMTFITMNSHGPWSNGPPIVADWKTLDTLFHPYPNGRPTASMHINDYWTLMEYELKMLTNFVIENGDEEDVFIILGDHNPAGLEWKLYNRFNEWATPIHIISKDASFVESFQQHGFTEGMQVDTAQYTIMRHMGLYSLLARQLIAEYGEEEEILPEYLPWGLSMDEW